MRTPKLYHLAARLIIGLLDLECSNKIGDLGRRLGITKQYDWLGKHHLAMHRTMSTSDFLCDKPSKAVHLTPSHKILPQDRQEMSAFDVSKVAMSSYNGIVFLALII